MNIILMNNEQLMVIIKFLLMLYGMNKSHILTSLIIIEFMAVILIGMSATMMSYLSIELYMLLFIMILLITESIMGLSLMINIIRTHSNDYLKSNSIITC